MGLINAIQTILYISRGGRLVRWDSRKHPRDKNGRFAKINGSSYLYGRSEHVSFTNGGSSNGPGPSSGITSASGKTVQLNPGDRVYGMATGSKVVQHADGTGTFYIGGNYNDRVHVNAKGMQRMLHDPKNRATLEHSVPGQIVQAGSEQEADQILNGRTQKVEHPRAPDGVIHVRVPEGSRVHRKDRSIVVQHADKSATIYDAKTGIYNDIADAADALPRLKTTTVNVSHPNADSPVAVDRMRGDVTHLVSDGVVLEHSAMDGGMFYPLDSSKEPTRIPGGKVSDFINEHGGAIASKKKSSSVAQTSPDDLASDSFNDVQPDDPSTITKTVSLTSGAKVSYRIQYGEIAVTLRKNVTVISPDGSGRSYYPSGRVVEHNNVREDVSAFKRTPIELRIPGSDQKITIKRSRMDRVYTLSDGFVVQDYQTTEATAYRRNESNSGISTTKLSDADAVDAYVKKHGGAKKVVEPLFVRNGEISDSAQHGMKNDASSSSEQQKPNEAPTPEKDKSASLPSDNLPAQAVARARRRAISQGSMPTSPDLKDVSMKHPTIGDITVKAEPGSSIRQVDNGFIVSYNDPTKPSILFRKDSHALTGLTRKEIDGIPVIAQINSDGSVIDFHDHQVYGNVSDEQHGPDYSTYVNGIPDSLLLIVDTQEERDNWLKVLRESGIEEMDGLPIEVKIQVRKKDK